MKKENKTNFTKLTQKKGISLIVLIVTIIVIIILAAAVILTLSKNNPIESAREATFKEDVRAFQDELALSISKEYTEKQGQRDEKITTSNFDEIKKYIPSFTKKYEGKFVIENDKLVGIEELTEKEVKWSQELSIVVPIKKPSTNDPVFNPEKWDETATSEDCFYWDETTITGFIPEKLTGVTKVRIPTKCTAIRSDYAHGGTEDYRNFVTGITIVEIPDTVTKIGAYAFHNFTKLTSINLPNGITSIGEQAFSFCMSLESITIPDMVTSIENSTFESCYNLKNILISKGVLSINIEAFSGCNNITNIIVDEENPKFDSRDNCNAIIETSTNNLFYGCKNTVIPEGIVSIGYKAFEGCDGLESITIPESVTSIGRYAFKFCDNLKNVTLPQELTGIGDSAFDACNSLTTIKLPEKLTYIGVYTFYCCENLTSITIPSSVTVIDQLAFVGCNNLTINCRAETQPSGWHSNWNRDNRPVNWGYTGE